MTYFDRMNSNNTNSGFNTYSDQLAAPKTSPTINSPSRWPKWLPFGNKNKFSKCPYCSIHSTEADILEHLKQCQQITRTVIRPDGSMASVTYAGPNNNIRASLKGTVPYNNNSLHYHQ